MTDETLSALGKMPFNIDLLIRHTKGSMILIEILLTTCAVKPSRPDDFLFFNSLMTLHNSDLVTS